MLKNATRVQRELLLWICLFLISVVVAVTISVALEWVVSSVALAEQGSGGEINIREMVRALIYELSFRVLGIFLLLAGVRLIFLTVSSHPTEDFTIKL